MKEKPQRPLGRKAYGSIGHLIGSRMGPSDRHVQEGQARICTEKTRDRHDRIIVQEKLDGSCCAVANIDGQVIALSRAGYAAATSPFDQHHVFDRYVRSLTAMFRDLLEPGERVVGEWLWLAHGTRYNMPHHPFVPFDILDGHERKPFDEVRERCSRAGLETPRVVHDDGRPISIADVMEEIERTPQHHGALDPIEGAVWRVERRGKVDFLAKFVRPDKADGVYLPELSGNDPVLNEHMWSPDHVDGVEEPH